MVNYFNVNLTAEAGAGAGLSPDRADGTDNGGGRGECGHKLGSYGKNALYNRKCLLDCWNEPLLNEVLLLGSVGTEIHFIVVGGVWGSKGVIITLDIIFLYQFAFKY